MTSFETHVFLFFVPLSDVEIEDTKSDVQIQSIKHKNDEIFTSGISILF